MKFTDFSLNQGLLKALEVLGYSKPTNVQEKCIPLALNGRDIVAQSKTGSGKTAAFGLPLLHAIEPKKGLQALILTPTRELCVQVTKALESFGKFLYVNICPVYGGVGISPQVDGINRAEIVVATPGRLLDHMERRNILFSRVKFLVIDEADKMFEMGFIEDVERIISQVPPKRQTMLFSATFSFEMEELIRKHMHNATTIKIDVYVGKELLRQIYYDVEQHDKFSLLVHLLKHKTKKLSIVFCATRRGADSLVRNLKKQGIKADVIHGGFVQSKRERTLESLHKGEIDVLIATDVAARGLDIKNISHIYNYDVPKTAQEYLHRIGRTARAGEEGDAVTLLCQRDYDNFNNVLRDRTLVINNEPLPSFTRVPFIREFERSRRFSGRRPERRSWRRR